MSKRKSLLALALVLAVTCGADQKNKASAPEFKGESVYNIETIWLDPSGKEIRLADFHGKKILMTMIYTHCQYTCPLMIAKLKEIETDLKKKGVRNYKIVLASFDHERDNPRRVAEYLKERKINREPWTMLSPRSAADVRELAAVLGITYAKEKEGGFAHSNRLVYLDKEGVPRKALDGVKADHKDLVAFMANDRK